MGKAQVVRERREAAGSRSSPPVIAGRCLRIARSAYAAGDIVCFPAVGARNPSVSAASLVVMKLTSVVVFASLSIVCACGGATPAPGAPSETTSSKHGERGEHGEHGAMAPALQEFHGVLAPVWHSPEGAARAEKTCANVKALEEKARATADAELIAATTALEAACAKDGRPEVEAKLTAIHSRFHELAEKHEH